MTQNKRFFSAAIVAAIVSFAAAVSVTLFYNAAHWTRGLRSARR